MKDLNNYQAKSANFHVFPQTVAEGERRSKVQADIRLVISFDLFVNRQTRGQGPLTRV